VPAATTSSRLGLRANLPQFVLLVVLNAFVGAIVGSQRSILPLAGASHFHLNAGAALTSFVVTFGLTKALSNLAAGTLAQRFSRRRVLIAGWLLGVPIPALLWLAMDLRQWWIIVAANLLLGVNQGLAWSMTVVMKVDLAGPARRGLALGLNECAGYLAVAASAWGVTMLATAEMPLRGVIGVSGACALAGLVLTVMLVKDTAAHAAHEQALGPPPASPPGARPPLSKDTRRPSGDGVESNASMLSSATPRLGDLHQAGMVTNLNDAVIWTTLPLLLLARHVPDQTIGLLAALYPATWGVAQLATGWLSDHVPRVGLVVAGLWTQAMGHWLLAWSPMDPTIGAAVACILLGVGTAMVYPTLLSMVAFRVGPGDRARSLGRYRFWRDAGYAIGALAAGVAAARFGLAVTVHASGVATFVSGVVVLVAGQRKRRITG